MENQMSEEEVKIRGELEREIERDLEGEIKDEIYRLALRLHRLYQHQHQQNHNKKNLEKRAILEVNISIKMEGGTKIEIKEIKKKKKASTTTSSEIESEDKKHIISTNCYDGKRVDWAKSLRSGPPKSSSSHDIVVRNNKKGTPTQHEHEHPKGIKSSLSKLPQLTYWK